MIDAGIEHNLRAFSLAMGRKMDYLGLCGQKVVKDESGKLGYTMAMMSGPRADSGAIGSAGYEAAKGRIARKVFRTFRALGREHGADAKGGGKPGYDGVTWYYFGHTEVDGIAENYDLTDANAHGLLDVMLKTKRNREGRINAGKRGKQTFWLWQRYVTKRETQKELIKLLWDRLGRRQAGWLPAWKAGGSPVLKGTIPRQVRKHENGARGYFINATDVKDHPAFTLINTATGSSKLGRVLNFALKVRAESLSTDLRLYMRGVKKLEQYKHLQ